MRRLRRRLRIVLGGLALAAVVAPSAAVAAGGVRLQGVDTSGYPTIRASVVTARPSRRPPSLTENGVPTIGLTAMNLAREKSVVIAIDRSRSMAGKPFADATAGAHSFVASKPGSDRVALVAFGRRAVTLTGFSPATIDADSALRSMEVDSKQGTALYDAVVLAARQLEAESNPSRVIVLLTDGSDVSSQVSLKDAEAAARDAGAAVYPIGIEGKTFDPGALKRLAWATGGSYHRAKSTSTLSAVYAAIAKELARTWRVEYLTAARPGDSLTLKATVPRVGSASASTTLAGAATERKRTLLPSALTETFASTITLGLLVALLVLAAGLAVTTSSRGTALRNRLDVHLGETKTARKGRGRQERFAGFNRLTKATDATFGHLKQWKALRRQLERADLPLRPAEFVYIAVACGLVPGLLAAVTVSSPIAIVGAMAAGGALPFGYAWFRAKSRLKKFDNQLPDLLVTIAASLKAGHSFRQGLQSVVEEGEPPASAEFKRVLTETQLGRPMDDALTEMGERVGSKNLNFVITAVTIQRQVGGSLAGLFDMVADAVRQRQQFARKIKGLTAMGRMSAYVLLGLPFFMVLAITVLNAEYMSPLYHTQTGHKLIFVGLAMMAFGSVVLKKIVSFKG